MIGPRPTKGRQFGGAISASSAKRPGAGGAAGASGAGARHRSRSRDRAPPKGDDSDDGKKKDSKDSKEFAWMDSGDESEEAKDPKKPAGRRGEAPKAAAADRSPSSKSSSSRSPAVEAVPVEKVMSLGQMARIAPDLEKKMKKGELRSKELLEVVGALSRSKFFDGGLLGELWEELRRAFKRKSLGSSDAMRIMCSLAELNAYNAGLFEVACGVLHPDMASFPELERQRLEHLLKQVKHNPGDSFFSGLRAAKKDTRQACPAFFRGQCKWGGKCKLSHDQESFDDLAGRGAWKPPTQSGGKSVGFQQSADLFKADRCGALW